MASQVSAFASPLYIQSLHIGWQGIKGGVGLVLVSLSCRPPSWFAPVQEVATDSSCVLIKDFARRMAVSF